MSFGSASVGFAERGNEEEDEEVNLADLELAFTES